MHIFCAMFSAKRGHKTVTDSEEGATFEDARMPFFLSFFQRRLTLHEVEHVFFFRVVGPGFKQGPHNVLCGLKDVIFGSSSVTSSYLGRPQYTL